MSLQSLISSYFTIGIAIFENGACQQSVSFPQATLCLWNLERKNRGKLAFKLCDVIVPKWIPLQKSTQWFGSNRRPEKRMRLTVSLMLNTKVFLNLKKKTGYKYMISLFFLPPSTQTTNIRINIKKFFMRIKSTINNGALLNSWMQEQTGK